MTVEQIKRGQELLNLIKITDEAIEELKKAKPEEREAEKIIDDKLYNLFIGQYCDGSGSFRMNLARYYGNERLINVILKELEKQSEEFKEQLEEL